MDCNNSNQVYRVPSSQKLREHKTTNIIISFTGVVSTCKLITMSPVAKEKIWKIFEHVVWVSRYPKIKFMIF
jgi:hypothetical protein